MQICDTKLGHKSYSSNSLLHEITFNISSLQWLQNRVTKTMRRKRMETQLASFYKDSKKGCLIS